MRLTPACDERQSASITLTPTGPICIEKNRDFFRLAGFIKMGNHGGSFCGPIFRSTETPVDRPEASWPAIIIKDVWACRKPAALLVYHKGQLIGVDVELQWPTKCNLARRQLRVFRVRGKGDSRDVPPVPSFDDEAEAAALGYGAMDLRSVASPGFFA